MENDIKEILILLSMYVELFHRNSSERDDVISNVASDILEYSASDVRFQAGAGEGISSLLYMMWGDSELNGLQLKNKLFDERKIKKFIQIISEHYPFDSDEESVLYSISKSTNEMKSIMKRIDDYWGTGTSRKIYTLLSNNIS